MPSFISKLQYTNCEQGEFFDEKVRSLDETIQLIHDFPWENQRRYIDNSLTGPSITIQNEQNDYLKVSNHNGSEFWVLLLKDGKLYEYPVKNLFSLDEAIAQVKLFFDNLTDISEYKLLRLELFAKRHFASKSYVYKASILRFVALTFLYPYLLIFCLGITLFAALTLTEYTMVLLIIPVFIDFYLFRGIYLITKKFIQLQNSYIQIAYGHNEFVFCDNGILKTCYKDEIQEMVTCSTKSRRGLNSSFVVYEVYFKDETFIKFNNMLIGEQTLSNKLPNGIAKIDKYDFSLKML